MRRSRAVCCSDPPTHECHCEQQRGAAEGVRAAGVAGSRATAIVVAPRFSRDLDRRRGRRCERAGGTSRGCLFHRACGIGAAVEPLCKVRHSVFDLVGRGAVRRARRARRRTDVNSRVGRRTDARHRPEHERQVGARYRRVIHRCIAARLRRELSRTKVSCDGGHALRWRRSRIRDLDRATAGTHRREPAVPSS